MKTKKKKNKTYFYQTLVSCKPQELHLLSKNYQRSSKEQNKQSLSGAYSKHIENKLPTHAVLMGADSPKPAPAVLNMIWGKHTTAQAQDWRACSRPQSSKAALVQLSAQGIVQQQESELISSGAVLSSFIYTLSSKLNC